MFTIFYWMPAVFSGVIKISWLIIVWISLSLTKRKIFIMSQSNTEQDVALRIALKRVRQLETENPDCDIEIRRVILTADSVTLEKKWGYAILKMEKDGRKQLIEFVENEYTWEKNWERIFKEMAEKGIDFRVLVPECVQDTVCKKYPEISSQLLCYDDRGRITGHFTSRNYTDIQS